MSLVTNRETFNSFCFFNTGNGSFPAEGESQLSPLSRAIKVPSVGLTQAILQRAEISFLILSVSYNRCTEIMNILISCGYDVASVVNLTPLPVDAPSYTTNRNLLTGTRLCNHLLVPLSSPTSQSTASSEVSAICCSLFHFPVSYRLLNIRQLLTSSPSCSRYFYPSLYLPAHNMFQVAFPTPYVTNPGSGPGNFFPLDYSVLR